jgi:hypothetical protein
MNSVPETGRLSENSDRSEGKAGCAGFFGYLRRIVALFNEKDWKIQPASQNRPQQVSLFPDSLLANHDHFSECHALNFLNNFLTFAMLSSI